MSIRRLLGLVAVAGVVGALIGLPARATYGAQVSSDEPQYLLTALSLGEDLDLDISDEIREQRYRSFHEIALAPQTRALNEQGQELSPHDPLLPVALALPMRLGGWVAAKAALSALAGALAAATAWVAIRRFGVSPTTAALVVGAFALAAPLAGYGSQVYPEVPAALAVMVAVAALTGGPSPRDTLAAAMAIVALPWLGTKYALVAAVLAALLLVRLVAARDRRRLVATTLGLAVMAVVYCVVHLEVYGGWTVYAAGDHFVGGEFEVLGESPAVWARSRRLLGLLVDRRFGLAAWTPSLLFAVPAIAALLRLRPTGWVALGAPLVAGWSVGTWLALTMHGWFWPGRHVVVVVPLLVVIISWWADRSRVRLNAVLAATAVGTLTWWWVVVEATTGRRALIIDFFTTANPWYRLWSTLLPDHQNWSAGAAALTGGWAVALGAWAAWSWVDAGSQAANSGDADEDPLGGEGADAHAGAIDLDGRRPVG